MIARPPGAYRGRPDGFGGVVLQSGDPSYDDARGVFNTMIDESAADVAAAVAYGVSEGLEIAVRGGGHGVAGTGVTEGGIVVDLRRMNSVQIDPGARIARTGGGALWADLDGACQPYGLLSVELVTADGQLVIADETKNTDLFWALHGGGGNFGVATSLTFRLHSLPVTTLALLLWPAEAGPEVTRAYRDLMEAGVPDELSGGLFFLTGPPEEFVPAHQQGKRLVAAAAFYAGTEAEARGLFAPMFDLAPEGMMVAEMPYAGIQSALDDPPGFRNYWSAEHLHSFPDTAVDVFCARSQDMLSPAPSQQMAVPWGGAVGRDVDRWPLPHRSAAWVVHPFGLWADPADDERGIAWARAVCADMKPYSTGAVYLNFIGEEGHDRVVAGFGRENYDRLAQLKAEYDPGNVFHLNQNVVPA